MKFLSALGCSVLLMPSLQAVVIDLAFDMQTFDPIQTTSTTEASHFALNGAASAPSGFNTFTAHTTAMATQAGVTLNVTGILGSWSGNNASEVISDALRADYFIIGTGERGTLTFSGLDSNASYDITFTHGNAEPTQFRGLDIVGFGSSSDIDNLTGGVADVSFAFTSDATGQLSVDLFGLGAQEGDLAGIRIMGGVVPEPSTYMLLLSGFSLLAGWHYFSRRRNA